MTQSAHMTTLIAEGMLHSSAACGILIVGNTVAQAVPVNEQTPTTIGILCVVAGAAWYAAIKFNNMTRDIKDLRDAQKEMRDKAKSNDDDARHRDSH